MVEVDQMSEMKIRVMVYGDETIMQGFIDSLAGEEIEVVGSSDKLQAVALLKEQKFDLAVVHSPIEEDKEAWNLISQFPSIPVMIVLEEAPNWEKLEQLEVDGYIYEEARGSVLAALLRAVARRRPIQH